jgi:hypothetical protein
MNKQSEDFPPDIEDFLHEICARAILRAIKNGTYIDEEEDQFGAAGPGKDSK